MSSFQNLLSLTNEVNNALNGVYRMAANINMSGNFSIMDEDNDCTEGYDENFEPPVGQAMECPICLLILRNPVQTVVCGHRFCRMCILKVIREGRKKCPIDNEDLDESKIFADNHAKREISQFTVRCRNWREHQCQWLGPLKDLQAHLQNCLYTKVDCTNACGMTMLRNNLENHLKNDCVKRIEACNYCKKKVVFKDLEDHSAQCPEYPVWCPNNCSVDAMPRKKINEHLQYECINAVVGCPFKLNGCQFEGPRSEVNKHFETNLMQHLAEFVTKFSQMSQRMEKDVVPVKTLQKASTPELLQNLPGIDKKVNELTIAVQEAKEEAGKGIQLAELYYSALNSNYTKVTDEMKVLSDRIDGRDMTITELQAKIWNGNFVWKILNFEKLFQQAKNNEVPAIHSVPFYSGIPGYKMCLRVNLNGVDSGASTHVSMFIHLMQGEFDSILQWPFPGKIKLVAVDQTEDDPVHVTETLVSRPGLQAFLRPKTPRNHKGYGYVEMVSHAILFTRQYIKNNSFIVHVSVSLTD